jgi:soluble lytic murein transglycosylase
MSRFRSLTLTLVLLCAPVACDGQGDTSTLPPARADTVAVRSSDPDVRAAQELLAQGHAYRATQRLGPLLADSARRTPEAVLVAAAAAAGWEGWPEVRRLLEGQAWVDSLDDGRGRMLLTRAALIARDAPAALAHASASLMDARTEAERGERLTLLARALDQLDQRDSAARTYERAAALVPAASDWRLLRAAGVESRPDARAALYARVTTPAARARVPWTELSARERFRDLAGAATLADSLGSRMRALRFRLAMAQGADERARYRATLAGMVRGTSGSAEAREAAELLEQEFGPLSPAEELDVARSASRAGPLARAVTGYTRAFAAGLGTPADRLRHGEVLIRLDRDDDAAAALLRLTKTAPAPVAAAAAYQRGRALLRGTSRDAARTTLRALRTKYPRDTSAVNALFLLGDMATDDGRDADAREAWLLLVKEHRTSRLAPLSAFRAAMVAMATREPRAAALELDSALARWPVNPEANAMRFWAGQAWAAVGDTTRARARWYAAADAEPMSYYAMRGAERLGTKPWAPPPAAPVGADDVVRGHATRAATLEGLGMDLEARMEYDALARLVNDSVTTRAIAAGEALVQREEPSRAIALGWRLVERGIRDARAYRLAYPVLERELIASEAAQAKLDPALVAALIRQESSFNPRATSAAGARGLMQVMPTVGAALARSRRVAPWDPVLLYQPDVNVVLGTTHLAGFLRQYPAPEYALAAYNAGPGRVSAWRRKAGTADPLLFVERIPFVETRDYVRIVLRNRALYAALYEW